MTMIEPATAYLPDWDPETYHQDPDGPSLSSSIARILVERSPLHAYRAHPRLGAIERAPTPAMETGTLIHSLVLGVGVECVIVDAKDWKTKAAQEARKEAREAGRLPVLQHEYDAARKMVDAVHEQLAGFGITLPSTREQAVVWTEESSRGPVLCRGMMDAVDVECGVVYDLKTTKNAHPRECARSVVTYSYDVQFAAYMSAIRHLRPDLTGREEMLFIFVETEEPYLMTPVRLDHTMIELGARRWKRAVELWAQCLHDDYWPGYARDAVLVSAPQWALRQEDEIDEEIPW